MSITLPNAVHLKADPCLSACDVTRLQLAILHTGMTVAEVLEWRRKVYDPASQKLGRALDYKYTLVHGDKVYQGCWPSDTAEIKEGFISISCDHVTTLQKLEAAEARQRKWELDNDQVGGFRG